MKAKLIVINIVILINVLFNGTTANASHEGEANYLSVNDIIKIGSEEQYYESVISHIKKGSESVVYEYEEGVTGDYIGKNGLLTEIGKYCQGKMDADNYSIYNIKEINYKTYQTDEGKVYYVISFSSYSTKEEEEILEKKVDEVIEQLSLEDKSDYEKIKTVHDYIIENVEYNTEKGNESAYDALMNGKGLCTGYSLLFMKFMDKLGIPSCCVFAGNHEWNSVYLENSWYNIDLTWDDSEDDRYRYMWFLQDDSYFKKFHLNESFCDAFESYDMPDFEYKYDVSAEGKRKYYVNLVSKEDGKVVAGAAGMANISETNSGNSDNTDNGDSSGNSENPVQDSGSNGEIATQDANKNEDNSVQNSDNNNEQSANEDDTGGESGFGLIHTIIFFLIGAGIGWLILNKVLKYVKE